MKTNKGTQCAVQLNDTLLVMVYIVIMIVYLWHGMGFSLVTADSRAATTAAFLQFGDIFDLFGRSLELYRVFFGRYFAKITQLSVLLKMFNNLNNTFKLVRLSIFLEIFFPPSSLSFPELYIYHIIKVFPFFNIND